MYITSEARMEKERVRERRREQEWRDRYKQEMDGFNRTDEESTVRTVGKEKRYRTGKSYSPSRGIPNNSTYCRSWLVLVFFRVKSLRTRSFPPALRIQPGMTENRHTLVGVTHPSVYNFKTPLFQTSADTPDTSGCDKSEGSGRTGNLDRIRGHDRKHENQV